MLAALTAGTNYVPAAEDALHAAADPALTPIAARSLYPDHVIFLGRGVPVIRTDETLPEKADLVLVEGAGAVLAHDASTWARAMAGCLSDVLSLLPNKVRVTPLSEAEEDALLDWDAERYRQKIARV
jgi:rhamnose utilization protein RhaD (predicted bifunctional aldolase and dehydrogenase)